MRHCRHVLIGCVRIRPSIHSERHELADLSQVLTSQLFHLLCRPFLLLLGQIAFLTHDRARTPGVCGRLSCVPIQTFSLVSDIDKPLQHADVVSSKQEMQNLIAVVRPVSLDHLKLIFSQFDAEVAHVGLPLLHDLLTLFDQPIAPDSHFSFDAGTGT